MLSSVHIGELVDTGKVDFTSKQNVVKPDAIVDYNENMGRADLLNPVIVPYSIQQKGGNKWYKKIMELFIKLPVYNAFIVWKKLNNSTNTQLIFRHELIQEIITIQLNGQSLLNADRGPARLSQNNDPLRLKGSHFIRKKARGKRGRSVRCNRMGVRHEVMFECLTCNISLCMSHTFRFITQ